MKLKKIIFEVLVATAVGLATVCLWTLFALIYWATGQYPNWPVYIPLWLIALLGIILLSVIRLIVAKKRYRSNNLLLILKNLSPAAADYIKLVIKYMRYRKTARLEVADELADHFESSLMDCADEQEKQATTQRIIDEFGDPKLLAVLMRRAKKRCRPLWQTIIARSFQFVSVLLVSSALYVVWFVNGRPVITTDYVTQLNNLVHPSADDSLNAAPLYREATDTIVDINDVKEFLGVDFHDATDRQKELIKQWLAKNETPLALVSKGAKLPCLWEQYRSISPQKGLFYVILPELADYRMISYALWWRTWLRAENGLYESAFDDIETCYRLARHNRSTKIPIEQIVGIALEAKTLKTTRQLLDSYKIPSGNLANFQQRLQNLIDTEDFTPSFKFQKFAMSDEIQQCFTESRFGPTHIYTKRLFEISPEISSNIHFGSSENCFLDSIGYVTNVYRNWSFFSQILFTHPGKAESIAMVDAFCKFRDENLYKTPAKLKTENINLENETKRILKNNLVLNIFGPSFPNLYKASWRSKIDAESTTLIIALVRYKQDTGAFPESLDKLVEQGYIKQVPVDPFSDKPITYRKTDNSFLLYSWGDNLKDDGGQVARDEKGKPIRFADTGDWVFWPVSKI